MKTRFYASHGKKRMPRWVKTFLTQREGREAFDAAQRSSIVLRGIAASRRNRYRDESIDPDDPGRGIAINVARRDPLRQPWDGESYVDALQKRGNVARREAQSVNNDAIRVAREVKVDDAMGQRHWRSTGAARQGADGAWHEYQELRPTSRDAPGAPAACSS